LRGGEIALDPPGIRLALDELYRDTEIAAPRAGRQSQAASATSTDFASALSSVSSFCFCPTPQR
jgi:hypothetical protein